MQPIPFIDLRDKPFTDLLPEHGKRTVAVIEASKGWYGLLTKAVATVALPLGDKISRAWLVKQNNPFLAEMDAAAAALNVPGVYALNCSYEWGCSTGVYPGNEAPVLTRVLDWPFPDLGKHMVVALQNSPAGEYHNATWPGMSGIFQAVAKGRFAAAINQAPMRRHPTGIFIDWARNRIAMRRSRALPPAHLLRQVFETAKTYEEAKHLLIHTPICLPVIYVLSGTRPGEGCVIERTETLAGIREMGAGHAIAANHFTSHLNGQGWGWLPRANSSIERALCAEQKTPDPEDRSFRWYEGPIANNLSRLVMQSDARTGKFTLMGVEGKRAVTPIFHGGE